MAISRREAEEIDRANRYARTPVVFVHGLWLLAGSWEPWRQMFEEDDYVSLAPQWPDEPDSVEEARRHPEVFAHKRIKQVADHLADVIARLAKRPAIIGHSFGGLLAQILAGRGLSAATVAIDPASFRGVLPLPFSSLRGAFPVLGNPLNYNRAVSLTYPQFRYAFANAVDEVEAKALHQSHAVACSAVALFQAATANLNPSTEAQVDTTNPARGPLLILSGQRDHLVPWAIAHASYRRQRRNPGITEIREIPNRGHSLTLDSGWRGVAEIARAFVERHHPPARHEEEARPSP